ncbi:MAG: hypothetical protein WB987_16810 [Candidatus Acidiferrales bacterium]
MHKLLLVLLVSALLLAPTTPATPGHRVHLLPEFKTGDILRYQIETRMTTAGKTATPIINPEGATQLKQSASITLRLDVLEVHPGAKGALGPMRLRATYEKSTASSETDAYDPDSAALVDQYNRLEGRSMEFTVQPDGKFTDIKGLEDMLSNPSAAQTVRSWMAGLSSSTSFPPEGIAIGQKWSREQPLTGIPLSGLSWRTEATYLRNEPCPENISTTDSQTAAGSIPSVSSMPDPKLQSSTSEMCAAILTQFTIIHRGSRGSRSGETPEDYRRNGLRTSGTWTGSGQSLDSISLATGRVIRSTQSSSQDVDYSIASTTTGSKLTYKGKIETQSQINLLPQEQPQPRSTSP